MSNRKALAGIATEFIAAEFRAQKGRLNGQKGRARVTVRAIADATGLGSSTVQRALSGAGDIAVEAYIAMCHALDLSPAGLMARAEAEAAASPVTAVVDAAPADLALPSGTKQRPRGSR